MDCSKSLLPDNETPLVLAIEQTMAQKYCCVDPNIIKALQDPWKCPVEFLPWLAYSQSVDLWNDRWPAQPKRTVIANGRELHRHKGTRGGLEDALKLLGIRLEMTSWQDMQPEGEVGTMDLMLWINDNFNPDADVMMDSQMLQDINQMIKHHKRLSVHCKLKTGIEAQTGFGVALSTQATTQQRVDAEYKQLEINAESVPFVPAYSTQGVTQQRLNAAYTMLDIETQNTGFALLLSTQAISHLRLNAII